MAITQTRMLALIKIADELKDQLLFTNRLISETIRNLPPSPDLPTCLATIHQLQNINNSFSINPHALEILATEKAHFKANATRNARHAIRARQKRAAPASPSTTAPEMIGRKIPAEYGEFFNRSTAAAIPVPTSSQRLQTGFAAQYNTVDPKIVEAFGALRDDGLISKKLEINKLHATHNMPEPYPDPYDDSPLHPDHTNQTSAPDAVF